MNPSFFHLSHDLLFMDAIGVPGSTPFVNAAWRDMLGWRLETLGSGSMMDLIHPEDLATHRGALGDLVAGRTTSFDGRMRMRTADGSSRLIDWHGLHDIEQGMIFFAGRDVTEEAELAERLARREAALSLLVAELVRVRETEQARIAGELHDEALQHAVAASMFLASPSDPSTIDRSAEQVQACVEAIRRVMAGLATDRVVEGGLERAVGSIVADTALQFQMDIDSRYELAIEPPDEIVATVCRIVREGLVNAGKHASSGRASVDIGCDGSRVLVRVSDEGSGGEPRLVATSMRRGFGYGLAALAELVRVQDGTMDFDITPSGSKLVATLPAELSSPT